MRPLRRTFRRHQAGTVKARRLRLNRPRPQLISEVWSGDVTVLGRVGRGPALALWVDPKVHAAEVARFRAKIVAGPGETETAVSGIGAAGYGRYFITRAGMGFCVRPNRNALALATRSALGGRVRVA